MSGHVTHYLAPHRADQNEGFVLHVANLQQLNDGHYLQQSTIATRKSDKSVAVISKLLESGKEIVVVSVNLHGIIGICLKGQVDAVSERTDAIVAD